MMGRGIALLTRIEKNPVSDLALLRRNPAGIGTVLDLQVWAHRPEGGYLPCGTVSAKPEVWARLLPALAEAVRDHD